MARKPVHLQAAGKLTPRDRIWAAIRTIHRSDADRTSGQFTRDDIADRIVKDAPKEAVQRRIEEETIRSYVACLVAGGYLHQVDEARSGRQGKARFALVKDVGAHAPRVDANGRPVLQGRGNEQMWRAMRRHLTFDFRQLAQLASTEQTPVSPETAQTYCKFLERAGYLRVERKGKGRTHTPTLYRFIRDTGPRAPMIQRVKHVYDPNLGKVVWHPEANA